MSKIRTERDRELMAIAIQIVSMCPESSKDALHVLNYARYLVREFICDDKERPQARGVPDKRKQGHHGAWQH
jgi:hypothetical protein